MKEIHIPDNAKIIIPARRNSKGLPFKNRTLIHHTLKSIPDNYKDQVYISSDDEFLFEKAMEYQVNFVRRDPELAEDNTSTWDVMNDLVEKGIIKPGNDVIMLYLTYPERTWRDIATAYVFYKQKKAKSLLCKKQLNSTHPFLYLFEKDGYKGEQLVEHDLYRRQDYPNVFEISHFITIFNETELSKLGNNLYNSDTIYYPIRDVIDVDTEKDILKLN